MTNKLLRKLSGGDLRSDGRADEVAEEVIRKPRLVSKLLEGLDESDDVVRARTSHALEKISRTYQEILRESVPRFIRLSAEEKVPMVKWHLAMIFGNMTFPEREINLVIPTLFHLLEDDSVFVRSWSIVSLCIIGRRNRSVRGKIIDRIGALQDDQSVAVRTKAIKALDVLENQNKSIPEGWSKARKT